MKATVLITSAGRRTQLLGCFRDAAHALGLELRLLATDLHPEMSAACQLADAAFAVPRCTEEAFAPELAKICAQEKVDLVVPTIDTELPVLSAHREVLAEAAVDVCVSAPEVIAIARDKERTAEVLAAAGVSTPRTLSAARFAENPAALAGPVIVKPRGGSSSIGIVRPRDDDEAVREARKYPDAIVQELWVGREYTVNCFVDRAGKLRCAVPHWRIETRSGEVSKGRTERVPQLCDAARKIATALPGARGPICFQAILRETGEYAVFEINARFGGGYPLADRAGATFTRWLLEETAGLPCTAHDGWKKGVTMLRYDTAVFLNE